MGHEELILDMIKLVNPLIEGEIINYYLVGNRGMNNLNIKQRFYDDSYLNELIKYIV